ncbi:MAG: DUF938 domain-containing protein [Myxococcales bacterium]|nr:DUF938 domain-containing protein [Myxococcales bacterium]
MTARNAPAAERNRQPILDALRPRLPATGHLLEIASGTGQHAAFFAQHLPGWTVQPTDLDPDTPASAAAWAAEHGVAHRVRPAVALDVTATAWPVEVPDAVFCANMIHIAPWAATEGLFAGLGRLGCPLFLYGPFRFAGETAPSNLAFEQWLKTRDPRNGVRDVEDLRPLAAAAGLALTETLALPANNHLLVWRPA